MFEDQINEIKERLGPERSKLAEDAGVGAARRMAERIDAACGDDIDRKRKIVNAYAEVMFAAIVAMKEHGLGGNAGNPRLLGQILAGALSDLSDVQAKAFPTH